MKSEVARAALDAGAAIVNDVSAFRLDPAMAAVAAAAGAGVILMHSRGEHPGARLLPPRGLRRRRGRRGAWPSFGRPWRAAAAGGLAPERIVLDPGFGFSKTVEQNVELFDQLAALQALGRPMLVGPSRKRFLGALTELRSSSATGRPRWPARWPGSAARGSSGSMLSRRRAKRWPSTRRRGSVA